MVVVTAVVTLAQFVLAAVVGTRLLRLPTQDRLSPERLLGTYLVAGLCGGGLLVSVAYGGWSAAGRVESPEWVTAVHAVGQYVISVGYACMLTFTWRTFYPDARWAIALMVVGLASLVVSLAGRTLWEGFAITVSPGFYHWLAYGGRMLGLGWMGLSSLLYWRRMSKRLALGLAEPMVVNRFALWSLFALGSGMTALSEPLARLIYTLTTGGAAASADAVQNVAGPIIQNALILTSIAGIATTAALFLTFFPTESYKRWVLRRSA